MSNDKEAALRAENEKLRELIKLSSDMEDEMPGCRACVQRHDEQLIAGGASITELHEGYHLMQLERYNKLVDRYNALYSEVFKK